MDGSMELGEFWEFHGPFLLEVRGQNGSGTIVKEVPWTLGRFEQGPSEGKQSPDGEIWCGALLCAVSAGPAVASWLGVSKPKLLGPTHMIRAFLLLAWPLASSIRLDEEVWPRLKLVINSNSRSA